MFISFVIFAVAFVVGVITLALYFYPGSRAKPTSIPGPEASDLREGNLLDIQKSGSLHEYLLTLHNEYGPIVSFWIGTNIVVSVSTASTFRDTEHLFDRPVLLFQFLIPLVGEQSLQFANRAEGRKRRNNYDTSFSFESCKKYAIDFEMIAEEYADKLSSLPIDQRIPVNIYTNSYALTSMLKAGFGIDSWPEKKVHSVIQDYHTSMRILNTYFSGAELGDISSIPERDRKSLENFQNVARDILDAAEQSENLEECSFMYQLLRHETSDDVIIADILTYLIGGFHTVSNLLAWCLYFLAKYPEVQEKVYQEIQEVIGEGEIDVMLIPSLRYTKQVLDETLRISSVAPFAARYSDVDMCVGGYIIPKQTPVIHAIGVSFSNEEYFPSSRIFDPDRFSTEQKKSRPSLAFQPFGFAGKRKCPAYRFAYMESLVFLTVILRWYKFHLPEDIVLKPNFGFVTSPSMELCVVREVRRKFGK